MSPLSKFAVQSSEGAVTAVPWATSVLVSDSKYDVWLALLAAEVESALRLRYKVFKVETAGTMAAGENEGLEFDEYDVRCRHLIVVERSSKRTVGTYRLNSV